MKISSRNPLIIACAALSIGLGSCVKQNLYIAQDYQKEYKYADAITFYKKAIEKNPSKEAVVGLADSYRILRIYPMAELWYAKAYALDNRDAMVNYQYAMMLKANGKYEDAKQFFTYYKGLMPSDSLIANVQIEGCDKAMMWMENPNDYLVSNRDDINSGNSDFGMLALNDSDQTYLFSTNRPARVMEDGMLAKENKAPYFEILGARMNAAERFDQVYQYVVGKNFPFHIATPCFTANFDTIFYTQTPISEQEKEQLNRLEIFYSVKTGNTWSDPISFPHNRESHSSGHPFLSEDGKTLYFISDRPGGYGGYDIYQSKKQDGIWTTPENLGREINSSENEFYPTVVGEHLYFSSMGHVGMGGYDIYRSRKVGQVWLKPENLRPPFNSSADDFAYFEWEGDKKGSLSSNRVGSKGADDVFSFEFIPPLAPAYLVQFKAKDMEGNEVPQANVSNVSILKDGNPMDMASIYTDEFGEPYYILESNESYVVRTAVPGYIQESNTVSFDQIVVVDTINLREDLPKQKGLIATLPLRLKEIAVGKEYNINNIYFDFNSARIRESAKLELIQTANLLLANKGFNVEIGSHCDARGSDEYNRILSDRRAKAVMNFLVTKGVDKDRLSYKGYGESQILNECINGVECTDEQHEVNRRTTFKIVE